MVVELVRDLGTGECSNDERRGGKGVGQSSVLQLGQVGGDNIDAVFHTAEAHVEEDVSSTVNRKAVARGHEDNTNCGAAGHQGETLRTTPGIKDLGHGNETGSRESIGELGGKAGQRVLLERTRDVTVQAAIDRGDESIDKVKEPDAIKFVLVGLIGQVSFHEMTYLMKTAIKAPLDQVSARASTSLTPVWSSS